MRNRFPSFNCGIGSLQLCALPGQLAQRRQDLRLDRQPHPRPRRAHLQGRHLLQLERQRAAAGLERRAEHQLRTAAPDNPNDTGNQFANMLLGNYTSVSQTRGIYFGAFRFFATEVYAQDSWKVNRKLTLEYGMRWAL